MGNRSVNIWINTGEPSGDLHGALLAKALKNTHAELRITGMGGPALRAEGMRPVAGIEELSVMGITEVLGHLPKILALLKKIKRTLSQERPDAVVLIDAPDFNFRVAKMAHKLGIPVFYYISPKLWAWRTGRAKFIKKYVRRMICIFPFEVEFYKQFNMDVDYVGNPLLDLLDWQHLGRITPVSGRVGFLPGSRKKEISTLMPQFAIAATLLKEQRPELDFLLVRAPNVSEQAIRAHWPASLPLTIKSSENRYEHMRSCEMLIAASGTVTLEAALLGTPTIVTYKVSPLSYQVGIRLVKVPYISLSNIILKQAVFPELLQENCDGEPLAKLALSWLDNPAQMETIRSRLAPLHDILGRKGAPKRAADIIFEELGLTEC